MAHETVVMLRNSERKSYLACRQQWWWSYVEKLESVETKPALRFGHYVHQALALWYKKGRRRGPHPAKSFERIYNEELATGKYDFRIGSGDDAKDALELGIDMLRHYVEHYGKDEHIEVIASEMPFQVPMLDRRGKPMFVHDENGTKARLVAVGGGDLVYFDHDKGYIAMQETKTAASVSTRHLPLDDQAGTYWTFVPMYLRERGILKPDQDIAVIVYNFLRKAMKDMRETNEAGHYLNKNGTVSKSQPPPYFVRHNVYRDDPDREQILFRVRAQAWEMDQVRLGKLPVFKNPSAAYPDQHCSGCEFYDMCELHETGSNWKELKRMTMTTWDPYEEHR